jgi:hypothetical protein
MRHQPWINVVILVAIALAIMNAFVLVERLFRRRRRRAALGTRDHTESHTL